ncbi:ferredoxin--NADP reductase [Gaetbulibacter aestuarii]|uniref:Ferredoxin--NADP reductase n=1 Tax=Gaetbulibacter aestuarii TaxID=1502358 RepID=A0ABW7MUP6_9FLAO
MSSFHKLSVANITRETADSVSIRFNIPEHLKDTFQFKAGQYITLKTNIDGKEIRRDYSLCVAPNSKELKVAVKEVEDGTFSAYANRTLKVGDTLEVASPKGRFIFTPNDSKIKNIVLFAAGSGITPVMSILKCALEEEKESKVVLMYGNKSVEDTMFMEELLQLQHQYKDRFSIQFIFSRVKEKDALFGHIEKSTVNLVLKNKYKHIDVDAFYICGPEPMIHTVKAVLDENGIAEDRVHFELFKASKQDEVEDTSAPTDKTTITITLDEETTTFEMSPSQSILEAALDEDLDAPYSCQGGICSTCLARLKEGEAKMRQNNILTDQEVEDGLILTCQAHPTSSKVVIDYDDV